MIIPLFTLSGVNGGPFRRGLLATVEMLHTAAPTYNPATFYSALLLPMLRPLQLVLPNGNTALNDFYAGFATWVALVIWLFAFSTPFTVVQLRLLRKARNVRTGLKGAAVGGPKVSADTQSRRSAYQRHKRSVLSRMENMSEFSMLIVITLLIWIIIAVSATALSPKQVRQTLTLARLAPDPRRARDPHLYQRQEPAHRRT